MTAHGEDVWRAKIIGRIDLRYLRVPYLTLGTNLYFMYLGSPNPKLGTPLW